MPPAASRPQIVAPTGGAPHCPWWEREDPYWQDDLWEMPPQWRPRVRIEAVRYRTAGGKTVFRSVPFPDPDPDALRRAARVPEWTKRVLAALIAYKHLTTKQIAALTGLPAASTSKALKPLWDAGVIESGRFGMTLVRWNAPYLWRVIPAAPLRDLLNTWDHETRLKVTGGIKPGPPRPHVRHDILANELALRLWETHQDTTAVFTEGFSDAGRLLGRKPTKTYADIVWVRSDNLRVAFEITGAAKRKELAEKIGRWAKLLSRYTWHETGLIVVFVNTAPRHQHKHNRSIIRNAHHDAFHRDNFPDRQHWANALAQIHVTDWEDWFPSPWEMSEQFTQLTTRYWRPDPNNPGKLIPGEVNLADPTPTGLPFRPAHPEHWTLPREAARFWYGTPPWTTRNPRTTPPTPPAPAATNPEPTPTTRVTTRSNPDTHDHTRRRPTPADTPTQPTTRRLPPPPLITPTPDPVPVTRIGPPPNPRTITPIPALRPAPSPAPDTRRTVTEFTDTLPAGLPDPNTEPRPDGSIDLNWDTHGWEITVNIHGTTITAYVNDTITGTTWNGPIPERKPDLTKAFASLIARERNS